MIKAVLFDFDETLQDRTAAFEKYMDMFLDEFCPNLPCEEREKRKDYMRITGNGGYVDREKWYQGIIDEWQWNDAPPAKELKDRGYIVGIITNGPSYLQNHKLDESGLRKYCDITVVSGDVGIHKPDPALFEYTANKLNLPVEECTYVGDHPINDIKGALDAGMHAIRMNWGWFKGQDLRKDVPVITDILDVLKYV